MSMSRTVDRPCAPRPVFETLPKAVNAAIEHGNSHLTVKLEAWAKTYGCTAEQVNAEFLKQQAARSLTPCGEFDK